MTPLRGHVGVGLWLRRSACKLRRPLIQRLWLCGATRRPCSCQIRWGHRPLLHVCNGLHDARWLKRSRACTRRGADAPVHALTDGHPAFGPANSNNHLPSQSLDLYDATCTQCTTLQFVLWFRQHTPVVYCLFLHCPMWAAITFSLYYPEQMSW